MLAHARDRAVAPEEREVRRVRPLLRELLVEAHDVVVGVAGGGRQEADTRARLARQAEHVVVQKRIAALHGEAATTESDDLTTLAFHGGNIVPGAAFGACPGVQSFTTTFRPMVESQKSLQMSPPERGRRGRRRRRDRGSCDRARALASPRRHPDRRAGARSRRSGTHQTGRSSGVIHAGIYYAPGSLKARLCVEGARELYDFCAERGIPTERGGKLIVATRPEELPRLDELERRGHRERGARASRGSARTGSPTIEPHARGIEALHSPATGTVDFRAVARRVRGRCRGGRRHRHDVAARCGRSARATGAWRSSTRQGKTTARALVSCAGAWSDRLAVAAGAPADPRIVPFRGGYLRLRPERASLVRSNIYPVPDPDLPFLGAHLTRGYDGEVLLGPTALMVGARDAYKVGRIRARDLWQTVSWPGTWRMARTELARGPDRDAARAAPVGARPRGSALRARARARRLRRRARRGSARRRSPATARWWTTSSCRGPDAASTSATRPPRPRPRRSRSRG